MASNPYGVQGSKRSRSGSKALSVAAAIVLAAALSVSIPESQVQDVHNSNASSSTEKKSSNYQAADQQRSDNVYD